MSGHSSGNSSSRPNERGLYPPLDEVLTKELGVINPAFYEDVDINSETESEVLGQEQNRGQDEENSLSVSTEPSTFNPPENLENRRSASAPPLDPGSEVVNEVYDTRDRWDSQLEFLFSCVSMSVGLGNVWRFPFTAYENGGGAFLIPYMITLLVLGRPLYYLEMCLGQFSSRGPVKVWEIVPICKGVGLASMCAGCCTASFYCSIMAITVYYFILSFSNPLPWSEEVCVNEFPVAHALARDTSDICQAFDVSNRSFSELYYFTTVFPQLENIEDGIGSPHWRLIICLLISWLAIYTFLVNGIKSAGKVAYFTALFPYVVLIVLLIRGATLPGATDGLYYFINPNWEKLLTAKVWFAAVSQCFFSLNVGFGTIIFLSSHNKFRHNVYRDAIVISITDTLTSCLAGCAIFALLGNLAYELNVPVSEVTRGGPALAFIAFPESIARLETVPQGFAILFFLMLFTLGVGSAIALAGHVITIIRDQFPEMKKWRVALFVCGLGFISGIVYVTPGGQFILTLVNHNGADFIIYVTGMIEIIAVAWIYGVNRFCDDIKFMLGRETECYWKICWAFIMPFGLGSLLVYYFVEYDGLTHEGRQFPTRALVCGWILSGVILSSLPICAFDSVRKSPGNTWLEKFKASLKPRSSWGPKLTDEREAWFEMRTLMETNEISFNLEQFPCPSSTSARQASSIEEENEERRVEALRNEGQHFRYFETDD